MNIPLELHAESLYAFYLLALCIPIVITTVGIRGVLEAKQRFGFINLIRLCMGLFTFLAPLIVLLFSKSLIPITGVLAAGRLVVLVLHLLFCINVMPALSRGAAVDRLVLAPLLRFGGWITVSNIVSPVMSHLDRFLVAALVSIAAVAYYGTPYSVVSNLLIIPFSISGVMFPAFVASLVQDRERTAILFARGSKYVLLAMFPISLLIVAFAQQGLYHWLGKEFAEHSYRVAQLLTIGVFINSLAQIPFALVQSSGRPDLTAKLHLIELPFYVIAVLWMTRTFGIEGTAIVWSARVMADSLILFRMAKRVLPQGSFKFQHAELLAVLLMLVLAFGMVSKDSIINVGFVAFAMILFACAGWFLILDREERSMVSASLNRVLRLFQRPFDD